MEAQEFMSSIKMKKIKEDKQKMQDYKNAILPALGLLVVGYLLTVAYLIIM